MNTNHYNTNLIDQQLSIGNNNKKREILPVSACNHIYSKDANEEKSGEDIVVQPTADKEVTEGVAL